MGDQIGNSVSGSLYYVPPQEFERIKNLGFAPIEYARVFSAFCRINILYMIARAGSGHIGSSFSSIDIMCWLEIGGLTSAQHIEDNGFGNLFFSSKGHDAPALYSVWLGVGKLKFDLIHQLRRLNGLPGHPDILTPNVVTNTGSLGMGISKAKGMILANRLFKRKGSIVVLTGDGELQEGQFWESLISAVNHNLSELTVIVDHNKMQSDTLVSNVSDLGNIIAKLESFGWHVCRCDGNDIRALSEVFSQIGDVTDRPKIIIADTIKGKGVSFMEHTSIDSDVELYKFHSGAPSDEVYSLAVSELRDGANFLLNELNAETVKLECLDRPITVLPANAQRLVRAYGKSLVEQAKSNSKIVVLDADLVVDTGLLQFKEQFPDRFIECGIAEQDMVSQAGGLALKGVLPIVHSFACFLSSRPNEQIYVNSTERRKIIYVGSLAGILPGGPGHSHQAVRDISTLSAMPGMILIEPSCEDEVVRVVDWAINRNLDSSYIRLCSLPWVVPYSLPVRYRLEVGVGCILKDGIDVAIIAYGPIMLSNAVNAADSLYRSHKISVKVINLPWLNIVDLEWLNSAIGECRMLISVDNHFIIGGQGDRIANALASMDRAVRFVRLGITEIPSCGNNIEVLEKHKLNVSSIENVVLENLKHFKL